MTWDNRANKFPAVKPKSRHPMSTHKLVEANSVIFKVKGCERIACVVGKHFFQYMYETCLSHEGNMQINPDFSDDFCWSHFILRNQPKKIIMEQVDICIMLGSPKPEWSTTTIKQLVSFKEILSKLTGDPVIEVISTN